MKNKLLIVGAGGHGKVVADIALKMNRWSEISFLDDYNTCKVLNQFEVIGNTTDMHSYIGDYDIALGFGQNQMRKKMFTKLTAIGASLPTLIHPSAVIGDQVKIGEATVVMAGTVINSETNIENACIINTASTIDHDNQIGNYVHISPGVHLAGNVIVGEQVWLGIGTIVSNNISITDDCIIGAGAVVVKNITETGTYIGVPARRI